MISEVHQYSSCSCCKQMYSEEWFRRSKSELDSQENICYFCARFLPMRNTKLNILNQIDNAYLWSGHTSRRIYYNEFINLLNKWCNHWSIKTTDEEQKVEDELRKVVDWTRDYWH